MAFDKDSPRFTFIFAAVMVVITSILLATAAISLKPAQDENIRKEKMQNILSSMQITVEADAAEAKFNETVKAQPVLDANGAVIEGVNAFDIDVQAQYKEFKAGARAAADLQYPLYECELDGNRYFVVPMVGVGLWGPVWGFVTLKSDMTTIYGASFDHKGETPGLGAEIKESAFEAQFVGKRITNDAGEYTGIKIWKGGGGATDPNGVDGITGGTITSNGVAEMLLRSFAVYLPYFNSMKAPATQPLAMDTVAADSISVDSVTTDSITSIL